MLFPHDVNMLKSYSSNFRKLIRANRVYHQRAEMSCIRGTGEGMHGNANKIYLSTKFTQANRMQTVGEWRYAMIIYKEEWTYEGMICHSRYQSGNESIAESIW